MAKWEVANVIDYSPNGDDIDTFSQKVKAEETVLYNLLQRLRTLDASTSNDISDAEAYQFKINTTTNKILIRDATNQNWIVLGDLASNFGITPALISAIKNLGGATGIQAGNIADRPVANNSIEGTLFLAIDEGSLYYFHNSAWILALSINISKLTGYSEIITKNDVSVTNAANKILKTDTNGKLDCGIKGSAEKLVDLALDKTNIGDGKVVAYDSSSGKLYFETPGATSDGGSIVGVIAARESLKEYSIGEKVYSSRLHSGEYLTCVTAGKTGEYQPDYSVVSNGKVVDGTVAWRKDKLSGTNIQFTSDIPTNQIEGDILIQKTSDTTDGGKNSTMFIKNEQGVRVPVYLKTNADQINNTPAGNVTASTVQAALNELDTKKAPAGYGLGGRAAMLFSVDLNTVYDGGFYWVINNCTNQPVAGGFFHLIVQGGVYSGSTPQNFSQIATQYNTGVTYTRTCINGTWSTWKQIATTESPALTGTVTLGDGQLKFPATQVASSDPNTLDDYEEGVAYANYYAWDGSTYTQIRSSADFNWQGAYTKIGNNVKFKSRLQHTVGDNSAYNTQQVCISLPFVVGGTIGGFTSTTPMTIGTFVTSSSKTSNNFAVIKAAPGQAYGYLYLVNGYPFKVGDWNATGTGIQNEIDVSYFV